MMSYQVAPQRIPRRAGTKARVCVSAVLSRRSHNPRQQGGDVWDVFTHAHGTTTILLADLSSKGTTAQAGARILRSEFRRLAAIEAIPSTILAELNTLPLDPIDDDPGIFATVFVAQMKPSSSILAYASAGHDAAIVLDGDHHEHLAQTGPVIGVVPGLAYKQELFHIERRSLLVIATDGVTEARDAENRARQFGTHGIAKALRDPADRVPSMAVRRVIGSSDRHCAQRYHDDATCVAIARV